MRRCKCSTCSFALSAGYASASASKRATSLAALCRPHRRLAALARCRAAASSERALRDALDELALVPHVLGAQGDQLAELVVALAKQDVDVRPGLGDVVLQHDQMIERHEARDEQHEAEHERDDAECHPRSS